MKTVRRWTSTNKGYRVHLQASPGRTACGVKLKLPRHSGGNWEPTAEKCNCESCMITVKGQRSR
jgi:hypothetical protein